MITSVGGAALHVDAEGGRDHSTTRGRMNNREFCSVGFKRGRWRITAKRLVGGIVHAFGKRPQREMGQERLINQLY
jgi:hypothetical protein